MSGNESRLDAEGLESVVRTDESLHLNKKSMTRKRDLTGTYFEEGGYSLKGTGFDKRRRVEPTEFHGAEIMYTAPWTEHDWKTDPLLTRHPTGSGHDAMEFD